MICGIVDLGSNTIRLSIYHWEGQDFRLLLNKKTMAGLAGYVQGGVLSDSGILVACRTLSSYRALLDNFQVSKMHVFATASLRNISNTGEAVETIRDVTGIPVEVLSGDAEAALSFKGAVLPGGVSTGLLADIGGGSFELVSYEDMSITSACSLPVGSLSLYTRFVNGLFPTSEERKAMRAYVEEQLETGKDVILEIEIQGALKVKEKFPETLLLFVTPPTAKELKHRLVGRGTETMDVIEFRMNRAKEEAEGMDKYDYLIVNDVLAECVEEVHRIIQGEHRRSFRNQAFIEHMKEELKGE